MPPSPGGNNTIEEVDGDPGIILSRGEKIKELGELMLDTSETLSDIKNNAMAAGEMDGLAVAALQDTIGDAYEKLAEAGELYKPVGPVLIDYGTELERIQGPLNETVEACETKWTYFYNLPPVGSSYGPRGIGGFRQPEEGSAEADAQEAEDEAKKVAFDAWETNADAFDGWYDAWDTAFEDAVDGMTEAVSGSIKDSFWSKVADILGWAALVVGIAALIFGGPLLAALALAVSAAYLVAVIMQKVNGEADGMDIAMAALGVVPVGKISNLRKFSKGFKDGMKAPFSKFTDMKGLTKNPLKLGDDSLRTMYKEGGTRSVVNKILWNNPGGRVAYVKESGKVLGNLDFAVGTVGNLISNYGRVDKVTGGGLPDVPKPLKVLF